MSPDGGILAVVPATATRRFSYKEYLEREAASEEKHEFCDGAIVAMAGGTGSHSLLKTNLTISVGSKLAGRPCRPFDSDLRVRVPATTLATYPDLTVICGAREPDADDRHAAINPTVLFEVLSKWTAGYDHGEKFDHYQQLPSLRQYVLLDHLGPHVYVFTCTDSGSWERRAYDAGERVPLASIDIELAVDELYAGWAEERAIDEGK